MTYIKEDNVAIGISIMAINAIESLRKLDIAEFLSKLGVHQKTHGFPYGFAIVDVVVTIQIQHKRCIGKHCRNSNLLMTYTIQVIRIDRYQISRRLILFEY